MLENLNNIDWENIQTFNGNAQNIPQLIVEISSNNKITSEAAYNQLLPRIWQQGRLCEASYFVIPFLLEILASPTQSPKENVYDILTELSILRGAAYENKTCLIDGKEILIHEACRKQVFSGREIFYADLYNQSNYIRYIASLLILIFKENYAQVLDELGPFIKSFGQLNRQNPKFIKYYEIDLLRETLYLILNPDN